MTDRLNSVRHWLQRHEIDFTFVQTKANVFYLSGFYSEPHERLIGLFIFPDHEPFLICPNMEVAQAKRSGWGYEVVGYNDSESPWELISIHVNKRCKSVKRVAIENKQISYFRAAQIALSFNNPELVSIEEMLNEKRMIKNDREISILRQAAALADDGVAIGIQAISQGKTEMDVLATIEYELKRKGIREMSFSTMVLTGFNTADPHGNPGLTQLKHGDFILFDLGVVLDGYCSDITRTVVFNHISEEQKRIYDTVLSAQQRALAICHEGTRVGEVDRVARNVITSAGYGEYFPHRIGHGLGIDVHEFPSMHEKNEQLLKEGFVFTIEPGIYLPGVGGVRIEDDVVITKQGHESLTNFPKELLII
ncbi:MAG: Xaa-Pro peptidase family protein [Bacillaceae bacterium]|nr:Xaa-Pro peptidase family protein [Bacillaceae bacterium]